MIFAAALCWLSIHTASANNMPQTFGPEMKIVVSAKKIWLVHDETPVKHLAVQIRNAEGKVVIEQIFSSKNADWSLDICTLAEGEYQILVGGEVVRKFEL